MRYIFYIIFFCLNMKLAIGQFDKKLTFNAFVGTTAPLGNRVNPDNVPYVFTNFRNGLQLGAGGQYNFSNKFSTGVNATALLAINYTNPIEALGSKQDIIEKEKANYSTSYFTNYSLGISLKYKLLRQAKVNPYVFGEVNINYYSGDVAPRLQYYEADNRLVADSLTIRNKYTIFRFNSKQINSAVALGGNVGVGIDVKISDTFTFMLQGVYFGVATKQNSELGENLNYLGIQSGLRFSILKQKSIL